VKILAIISIAPGAEIATIRQHLGEELRGSWDMFATGTLREAYATENPGRVVFILETDSIGHARTLLGNLPLVQAGCFALELLELRPFVNWSFLFSKPIAD